MVARKAKSSDVKAANFAAFFDEFLQQLENGVIVFNQEYGGLVTNDE